MSPDQELRLHRFLGRLYAKRRQARDVEQAVRSGLRECLSFLSADAGALAGIPRGESRARVLFSHPQDHAWDETMLTRFLARDRPQIPDTTCLAPLYRRGRLWRVIAVTRRMPPAVDDLGSLQRIARALCEIVERVDRERLTEVRSRIERKIVEELNPKDLFYQILHGLKSLTRYDHSGALLIAGPAGDALELVAEQVAWRKGKSDRIGLRLGLDTERQRRMIPDVIYGFSRAPDGWTDWTEQHGEPLAHMLDYNRPAAGDDRCVRESGMLCAPLATRDGIVGLLKVATIDAQGLGQHELELVRKFLPQAAVAIQNSRRTETLEARLVEAEKKHAMADLARGVAHDVNNALGSVLPLVQQLLEDSRDGSLDRKVLTEDLEEIERSLHVCRRIFGGMLRFAQGEARGPRAGDLVHAIDSASAILADSFARRRIDFDRTGPEKLPAAGCSQGELDQLVFNLLANARDAMPQGGVLRVRSRRSDSRLELEVEDNGTGIPEELLAQVQEPFFTTKNRGNGLGLAICRSILWSVRGNLEIHSEPGVGTRVRVAVPIAAPVEADR